jgi:hypothetical protein
LQICSSPARRTGSLTRLRRFLPTSAWIPALAAPPHRDVVSPSSGDSSSVCTRKSSSLVTLAQPSLVADLVFATSRAHVRHSAQGSRCIWSRRDAVGSLKSKESTPCCNASCTFFRPGPSCACRGLITDGRTKRTPVPARFSMFRAALCFGREARCPSSFDKAHETIVRACPGYFGLKRTPANWFVFSLVSSQSPHRPRLVQMLNMYLLCRPGGGEGRR